jgi:hypothetical protein
VGVSPISPGFSQSVTFHQCSIPIHNSSTTYGIQQLRVLYNKVQRNVIRTERKFGNLWFKPRCTYRLCSDSLSILFSSPPLFKGQKEIGRKYLAALRRDYTYIAFTVLCSPVVGGWIAESFRNMPTKCNTLEIMLLLWTTTAQLVK